MLVPEEPTVGKSPKPNNIFCIIYYSKIINMRKNNDKIKPNNNKPKNPLQDDQRTIRNNSKDIKMILPHTPIK